MNDCGDGANKVPKTGATVAGIKTYSREFVHRTAQIKWNSSEIQVIDKCMWGCGC